MKSLPKNNRIPVELETELRQSVKDAGNAVQESYRQKALSYIQWVKSVKKGLKTIDETLVKIANPKE
jgi:hypothetical protein